MLWGFNIYCTHIHVYTLYTYTCLYSIHIYASTLYAARRVRGIGGLLHIYIYTMHLCYIWSIDHIVTYIVCMFLTVVFTYAQLFGNCCIAKSLIDKSIVPFWGLFTSAQWFRNVKYACTGAGSTHLYYLYQAIVPGTSIILLYLSISTYIHIYPFISN